MLVLQQKVNQEQEKKLMKNIMAQQEKERKEFIAQQKKEYKQSKEQIKRVSRDTCFHHQVKTQIKLCSKWFSGFIPARG